MNPYRREGGLRRARRVLRIWRARGGSRQFYDDYVRIAGRMLHTRTPCSCPMCGNPRRHFGKVTRQEMLTGVEEPCG